MASKKKRRVVRVRIAFPYAWIAVALLVCAALFFWWPRPTVVAAFHPVSDEQTHEATYTYDSGAAFYSYQSDHFFYASRNGVQYISSKGVRAWEDSFQLTTPVLTGRGGYIAVGETGGYSVYVYNAHGKCFEQRFDHPILSFTVNTAGVLTVILQLTDGYLIESYGAQSLSGNRLLYYQFVDPNIYPVSADTSLDGRITAVAFLNLSIDAYAKLSSRVTFIYSHKDEAKNFQDGIFARTEAKKDQIISSVRFMENNKLLIVSDDALDCLQPEADHQIKKLWSISLHNQIECFSLDGEEGFAFVTGEPFSSDEQAEKSGTLLFYTMNGKKRGVYQTGDKAEALLVNGDDALVVSGRRYTAVSGRGRLLWKYDALSDFKQIIFLENTNTLLMADNQHWAVMKRG
jgi:hypothetical protein